MTIDQEQSSAKNPWREATERCWRHVRTAVAFNELINTLTEVEVGNVITLLSDTTPTLLITPKDSQSIESARKLARAVSERTGVAAWTHLPINGQWCFRQRTEQSITIDIMTQIEAVREAPVTL